MKNVPKEEAFPEQEGDLPRLACSVTELSQIIGISRNSAYALVHSGAVQSVKAGNRIIIPFSAIHTYLAGADQ